MSRTRRHLLASIEEANAFPDEGNMRYCRACRRYEVFSSTDLAKNQRICGVCGSLWDKHRMTRAEFEEMEREQDGACAICGGRESLQKGRLSVDHDHACCPRDKGCGNCVRGLLCHRCNVFIGGNRDELIHAASRYLMQRELSDA